MGFPGREFHLVNDRVKIETRAATKNWGNSRSQALIYEFSAILLEPRNGIVLIDTYDIDHLQRNTPLLKWHLSSTDIHAAINLHGIDRDDVTPKLKRDEFR